MRLAGFIVIILIIGFILRPSFFMNLFSKKTNKGEVITQSTQEAKPAADTSKLDDGTTVIKSEDGVTMVAPGYDAKKYSSDAYNDPNAKNKTVLKSQGGAWDNLLKLTFNKNYDAASGELVMKPKFTSNIISMDGKKVSLKGFLVPTEQTGSNMTALSAYPVSTCFFCGGAGPESVIEVYPTKPIKYVEGVVELEGTLRLNYDDQMKMPYILEKASIKN